jgi:hypothetical protein
MKPTSSLSGKSFCVIELISVAWLPPGRSVRPTTARLQLALRVSFRGDAALRSLSGRSGISRQAAPAGSVENDPYVWTGRALQAEFE